MQSFRAIRFEYSASDELRSLFEEFRLMCNDALRIAVKEKPTSRFALIRIAYPRLKQYGLHSHYALGACEVAYAAFKNKRRKSCAYFRRTFLKLDNQSYPLNHLILRIPTKPRRFVYLVLASSNYHLSLIDNPALKKGSIVVTGTYVSVVLSKKEAEIEKKGAVGVDINERNITTSDSLGNITIFDISRVTELRARYREIRAKISRKIPTDSRVRRRLLDKYGRREKNRTVKILHNVSKAIVSHARENQLAIGLENLKGIRRRYMIASGLPKSFRRRMNGWPFREIQRQVEYKAAWCGIPVFRINPAGTSRRCPNCSSHMVRLPARRLFCQSCQHEEDRDIVASRNIMKAALVCAVRPSEGSGEGGARRQMDGDPQSRWMEAGSRTSGT